MVRLLCLISQFDRDQIPVNNLQRSLLTRGTSGSLTGPHTKKAKDFDTEGIKPIPYHSHNDYEHRVPSYDALNVECVSVEVDIWLQDGDLLIGHEKDSLDPSRTLKSLYLNPLTSILGDRNPNIDLTHVLDHSRWLRGIDTTNPNVTLTLLIDAKPESEDTLPVLTDQLLSLHKQGLLTRFDGTRTIHGPMTVVGTGNANFNTILDPKDRFIFFDAPLDHQWSENLPTDNKIYNGHNSYYASISFNEAIGKSSLSRAF
ncbi:MAG: hypothetical protein Q9166_005087 [cf. Caloplaca sp. 2 TL-2023]